jgi:hypothetical protein
VAGVVVVGVGEDADAAAADRIAEIDPRGLYAFGAKSRSAANGCDIRTLSMNSVQGLGSVTLV